MRAQTPRASLSPNLRNLAQTVWAVHHGSAIEIDFVVDDQFAYFAIDRHLVGPLLYQAIKRNIIKSSESARRICEDAYRNNVQFILFAKHKKESLSKALDQENIDFTWIKGLALSDSLYQEEADRNFGDLDLLVSIKNFPRVSEILRLRNYCDILNRENKHRWLDKLRSYCWKGTTFIRKDDPISIDVHHRAFPVPKYFPNAAKLGLAFKELESGVQGITPESAASLFIYLLCHGGLSGWTQLKWILDIALLIRSLDKKAIQLIIHQASEQGYLPAIAMTTTLCDQLFGTRVTKSWFPDGFGGHSAAYRWRLAVCTKFIDAPINYSTRSARLIHAPISTLIKPLIPRVSLTIFLRLVANTLIESLLKILGGSKK